MRSLLPAPRLAPLESGQKHPLIGEPSQQPGCPPAAQAHADPKDESRKGRQFRTRKKGWGSRSSGLEPHSSELFWALRGL